VITVNERVEVTARAADLRIIKKKLIVILYQKVQQFMIQRYTHSKNLPRGRLPGKCELISAGRL